MKLAWATVVALMLMVSLAETGQGEVCYSSPLPVTQANPLTNATTFACASLGAVTIPQIYQLGWRVAQLSHLYVGAAEDGDGQDPTLQAQADIMPTIGYLRDERGSPYR